jgi:hypothetical protein
MLPASYQSIAAVVLLVGGALACVAGYRLFKVVLAVFGAILGGLAASSLIGESTPALMVGAAIGGAIVGALIMLAAYFVGVALVGAGLGAGAVHLIYTQLPGDPHPFLVVLAAVGGALLSTWLQRYVIILSTAFGGAWTLVVGAAALRGAPEAMKAAAEGDVWVAYPMNPAPGESWVLWAFLALGAVGTFVQMRFTAGDAGRVRTRKKP